MGNSFVEPERLGVLVALLKGEFHFKTTRGINIAWVNYWQNTLQSSARSALQFIHSFIHSYTLSFSVSVCDIKIRCFQVKQPTAALLISEKYCSNKYLHLLLGFISLNDAIFNNFPLKSEAMVSSRLIPVTPMGKSTTVFYSHKTDWSFNSPPGITHILSTSHTSTLTFSTCQYDFTSYKFHSLSLGSHIQLLYQIFFFFTVLSADDICKALRVLQSHNHDPSVHAHKIEWRIFITLCAWSVNFFQLSI